MLGLGTPELIAILAIAALLFGGRKLPEIGTNLGKAITGFKKGVKELEETGREIVESLPDADRPAEISEIGEDSAAKGSRRRERDL